MMPGQSFRLPFAVASDYQFVCTAHASGQMTVIVELMPESAWARIWWRLAGTEATRVAANGQAVADVRN